MGSVYKTVKEEISIEYSKKELEKLLLEKALGDKRISDLFANGHEKYRDSVTFLITERDVSGVKIKFEKKDDKKFPNPKNKPSK